MKQLTSLLFLVTVIFLSSCASNYHRISPNQLYYTSKNENNGVSLSYKYNVLNKKYAKKEEKNGILLVAVKITNNSPKDIVFGEDIKLVYDNGNEVFIPQNKEVFKSLKQHPAYYLLYLLLTPMQLITNNSQTPIGLVVGPGVAGGNLLLAASANKKFKSELFTYNLHGVVIRQGETKFGLIGIISNSYDAIKIKFIKTEG